MNTHKPGGTSEQKQGGAAELGRGASVGRYLIVGLLGKGGMGEVYAAYDAELDRKIALKLLRPHNAAGVDPSEGRSRLLREAQAIARLSDPNVVVVFDVGTFEDRVFLAMEFVDGNTLGYWLQAKPRTWREVVATFTAAGRGLASAHRAGVVHRDFKPENVMIGRDGKVRVMDFGLARSIDSEKAAAEKENPTGESTPARLTPVKVVPLIGLGASLPTEGAALGSASLPSPSASLALAAQAARASGLAALSARAAPSGPSPPSGPLAPSSAGVGGGVGVGAVAMAGAVGTSVPAANGDWTEADTATRDLSKDASFDVRTEGPTSALNSRLTVTGAMMGTPAYMAPEQFRGATIDARADQFSFCVALYEALYGERPYAGKNLQELTENVIAGHLRPVPANAKVPGWLRRVVLRGVRVDRAERHASMETLLAALAKDPARTRRRWAGTAAVLGVIGVLSAGLLRAQQQQRVRCLGADAKLAGIWELPSGGTTGGRSAGKLGGTLTPRKEAIRRAFMATGKRYAADSFEVVRNALDRYVVAWNDMHRDSCQATNMRGEQSAEVLDLRTACLQDRFNEVRALTGVFSDANGDVVTKSVEAVQAIRPVEQCADIAALRAVVRPPDDPATRQAVAAVRTQLADIKALANAGRYKKAADQIAPVAAAARTINYRPLIAESLVQRGLLEEMNGEHANSEKTYEEAVWIAEASHHDEIAAEAEAQLIAIVGYFQGRHAEGERWAKHSEAVLQRLGSGHDVLSAWRSNNLALVFQSEGRFEEALASNREAVTLKMASLGEANFDVALSLMNLALGLGEMGRVDEAVRNNQQALKILQTTVGPEHPYMATCLSNGAEFENARKHFPEAQAMAERALLIGETALGSDHPFLAYPLTALGWSLVEGGAPAKAVQHLERALAIREKKDPEPTLLGDTRFALANALISDTQFRNRAKRLAEEARIDFQRSSSTKNRVEEVNAWIDSHDVSHQRVSLR